LVRARTFDIRVDDGSGWSGMSLRVPLLHDRTRWFQYGATLTSANGRIDGLCNIPHNHPDFTWLVNLGFSEDQVFYSPNFRRVAGDGGIHNPNKYVYIGRKGPKFSYGGFTNCQVPYPQKSYSDHTIGPRCGHCRCLGHTADWAPALAGRPRTSTCPLGNDKDLYRKERVDKRAIIQC
jgi:hypothetical protein